jgi:hypothetical protein
MIASRITITRWIRKEKYLLTPKQIDDLISYWKDNRSNRGLWFDHLEKVNDTLLALEYLKALIKFGVKEVRNGIKTKPC